MRTKHLRIILAMLAADTLFINPVAAGDAVHASMANMSVSGHEAAYVAENAAAMSKMMTEMDVKPTGDVDRDFVAMMTPHHQGAIDMAAAVVKTRQEPEDSRDRAEDHRRSAAGDCCNEARGRRPRVAFGRGRDLRDHMRAIPPGVTDRNRHADV